jgi:hypothetical protein
MREMLKQLKFQSKRNSVFFISIAYFLCAFCSEGTCFFKKAKKETLLKSHIEKKLKNFEYLKEYQIAPFPILIENQKNNGIKSIKFGSYIVKENFIYLKNNYILESDENLLKNIDTLFSFHISDTTFIHRFGTITEHKCFLQSKKVIKSDTIYIFKLINTAQKTSINTHDFGNEDFFEIQISKIKGFVSVKKRTDYFLINYRNS